jgi:hypothetical protein
MVVPHRERSLLEGATLYFGEEIRQFLWGGQSIAFLCCRFAALVPGGCAPCFFPRVPYDLTGVAGILTKRSWRASDRLPTRGSSLCLCLQCGFA